jgi:hypothetical protein
MFLYVKIFGKQPCPVIHIVTMTTFTLSRQVDYLQKKLIYKAENVYFGLYRASTLTLETNSD